MESEPGKDQGSLSLTSSKTIEPWEDSFTALVDLIRQGDSSSVTWHGRGCVYDKEGPRSVRVVWYKLFRSGKDIADLPKSALI